MKKFDEIVSLGYNCEISFRIRNFTGNLNSWPFSWSYILDRDKFLDSLTHLDEIFQGDVSIADTTKLQSMIQCDKYKICFHPRSEFLNVDGTFCDEKYESGVKELKDRVKHLTDKFQRLLTDPNKKTLFIVGLTDNGTRSDVTFVKELFNVLNRTYLSGNFTLLVVVPKWRFVKELKEIECEKIKIRKIRKFGIQKYNEIITDSFGWAKIFVEFLGIWGIARYYRNLTSARIKRIFTVLHKCVTKIFKTN